MLALLTSRIIPLKAKGVVSFSYRHRPGLSFINCFDRDNLDLIDDVIHENSHHHLNLLLRKQIHLPRGSQPADLLFPLAPQPASATRHSPCGLYVYDGSDALRTTLNVGIGAGWIGSMETSRTDLARSAASQVSLS